MDDVSNLAKIPRVDILHLSRITAVPEFHPEHGTFAPFPVYGFVIHHPDGPIVVDTGIGRHAGIDALYGHESVDLIAELHRFAVDERDVQLIVNSHLHFDHCGQNHSLDAPITVQRAELEAAQAPFYTVPEWAVVEPSRSRVIDGDVEVAPGITAMLTPGHTPGHQAIVITACNETVVIAAQCIFRATEWSTGVEANNLHDLTWRLAALESVGRLRALRPRRVFLSHDSTLSLAVGETQFE